MKIKTYIIFLVFVFSSISCKEQVKSSSKKIDATDVRLCNKRKQTIELFSEVAEDPERMFTAKLSQSIGFEKVGNKAILLESFDKGFEAEPIAEKIELSDGRNGWVNETDICIPAKIIKSEGDGKNHLRDGETFSHQSVEEILKNDIVFIQKSTYSTIVHFKGCEEDWYYAVSEKGNFGYIHCAFVEAIE